MRDFHICPFLMCSVVWEDGKSMGDRITEQTCLSFTHICPQSMPVYKGVF